MKLVGVRGDPARDAARGPVPDVVRHRARPGRAAAAGPGPHDGRRRRSRAGPSASPMPGPLLLQRVRRRQPARAAAVPRAARWPPAAEPDAAGGRAGRWHRVKGHRMAKAALETAVLDAELRAARRMSLAAYLGARRGPGPVRRLGRASWTRSASCSTRSSGYLAEGYLRIKLKIEPGWDVEPVRAVRERFGDDLLLQVDANTAYTLRRRRPPGPARRLRPAADRAAAGRGRPARARRAGQAPPHADLPGRVHRVGPRGRRRDRPGRLPRSSTSSRAGSAATSRPAGSTTSAAAARRAGVVRRDAGDRASAGPRTWRWPRCPASPCPATPRRPAGTTHRHHRAVRARRTAACRARRSRDRRRAAARGTGRAHHARPGSTA